MNRIGFLTLGLAILLQFFAVTAATGQDGKNTLDIRANILSRVSITTESYEPARLRTSDSNFKADLLHHFEFMTPPESETLVQVYHPEMLYSGSGQGIGYTPASGINETLNVGGPPAGYIALKQDSREQPGYSKRGMLHVGAQVQQPVAQEQYSGIVVIRAEYN